jgi:uncharacterized protein YcbK (DUF882 family)
MKLSKHFHNHEFFCRHCRTLPEGGIDRKLLEVLDAAREDAGGPIVVSSGYRCTAHNAAIGGAPQSYHVRGMAADVYSETLDVYALSAILKGVMIRLGVEGGLQVYAESGFVHVDTRGWWATWCI